MVQIGQGKISDLYHEQTSKVSTKETVLTESPKCLLTLPPKGWKPESRILLDLGLFAEEPLYFRSGIRVGNNSALY